MGHKQIDVNIYTHALDKSGSTFLNSHVCVWVGVSLAVKRLIASQRLL